MTITCAVVKCVSRKKRDDVIFYKFPTERSLMNLSMDMTGTCLCRICSLTRYGIFIFSDEGIKLELPTKINYVLGITVIKNDNLPKHICYECFSKLNYACDFKKMFERSQAKITCSLDNKKPCDKPVDNIIYILDSDENDEDGSSDITIEKCSINCKCNKYTPNHRTKPKPDSNAAHSGILEKSTKEKVVKKKVKTTICIVCGKWVPTTQLDKHEETVHLKKKVAKLSCSICNIEFVGFKDWAEHAQKLHVDLDN